VAWPSTRPLALGTFEQKFGAIGQDRYPASGSASAWMITRAKQLGDAKQLRDMASECRSIAEITKDPTARQNLLEVADQLERLARHHESIGKKTSATQSRPITSASILPYCIPPITKSVKNR